MLVGGGFSATISAEGRRTTQIIDDNGVATAGQFSAFTRANGYGGWKAPDIIGNIRIDQAWGSAQIMAAGHEVNPLYYGTLETSGGPDTTWGWAAGAGAHLNLPFIWQGDYIEGEFSYSEGALQYLANSTGITQTFVRGGTQSWGLSSDCIFDGTTAGLFGPRVSPLVQARARYSPQRG